MEQECGVSGQAGRRRPRPVVRTTDALRVPPHSVEAEQAVLGGLLLDNSTWDSDRRPAAPPRISTGATTS